MARLHTSHSGAKVNIRPLTNADLFTVIGMLKKIGDTTGSKLTGLFTSATGDAPKKGKETAEDLATRIGFMVLGELYENLVGDLKAWFASLCNVTIDEYLAMPPETTIDIIEQLTESENTQHFFSRALALSKKMSAFGSRFSGKSK